MESRNKNDIEQLYLNFLKAATIGSIASKDLDRFNSALCSSNLNPASSSTNIFTTKSTI